MPGWASEGGPEVDWPGWLLRSELAGVAFLSQLFNFVEVSCFI
jgi:hypothetical protein